MPSKTDDDAPVLGGVSISVRAK